MQVTQLNEIVLSIHKQLNGQTELAEINSSNIVDVGKEILGAVDVDNYVKMLTDRIGRTIFKNRKYQGSGVNVLRDAWEFGSILQKIDCSIKDTSVVVNDTWNLTDGTEYKQDTFKNVTVTQKLFNKKVTFEIDVSFTERQVKSSFNSMEELNAFISMIYTAVENAFTVKLDGLIMATLNNLTAETLGNNNENNAVNLLTLYKAKFPTTDITAESSLTDSDFLKFASMTINNYVDRVSKVSTLFNITQKERFTPKDELNIILLSEFKSACASYLQADTFNKELVELPNAESVPYWQGSGNNYSFESVSSINVKTSNGNVTKSGILAVMFDKNAVAVCNEDRRVTTHYNAKGEFFTNFYKFDCSYLNDLSENYIVFYVEDVTG